MKDVDMYVDIILSVLTHEML